MHFLEVPISIHNSASNIQHSKIKKTNDPYELHFKCQCTESHGNQINSYLTTDINLRLRLIL